PCRGRRCGTAGSSGAGDEHGVAEREEAIPVLEGVVVEVAPAGTGKGVEHQQQARARQVEVREQDVDDLEPEVAVNEEVGSPTALAEGGALEGADRRGADGDNAAGGFPA